MADLYDPYNLPDDFGDTDPPVPNIIPGSIFGSSDSQSPTTAAPASTSWTGLGQITQVAKDAAAVVATGFGLSLAKDQIAANRDIAKYGLDMQRSQAALTAVQARNAAALAQRYPTGVPFGATRTDQIMIIIGLLGLAFAYMQTTGK